MNSTEPNLVSVSAESILSTPQKPKRLSPAPSPTKLEAPCIQGQTCPPSRKSILECREGTSHSLSELYRWTFGQASVAPVRAKHVFEMDRMKSDSKLILIPIESNDSSNGRPLVRHGILLDGPCPMPQCEGRWNCRWHRRD